MQFAKRFASFAVSASISMAMVAMPPALAAGVVFHHSRLPAAAVRNIGWAANNWSGYAKTGSYTSVTASWVVPAVAPTTKRTFSSNWVGIDGFNNGSLIQTGTESDYYNGSAHYYAWWEILPAPEAAISSMTVHPGDRMSASIAKGSGGQWTISITDNSTRKTFTTQRSYSGPGSSVEWILEAPTVGGHTATLARYSSPDTFDPGTANGRSPGLSSADGGVMVEQHRQISTPSGPDRDRDGFNMSYGNVAPGAPSS